MPTFNSRFLYFLLCVTLITGCNRCKEDCDDPTNPECPNYDPCIAWNAQSQEIKIIASGSEALDNDTLWCLSQMTFELAITPDSAKWIIGSDPTIHESISLNYYFGSPYESIQIKSISYRTDELNCVSGQVVADTLTKTIKLVHWPDLPIWTWEFDGSFEDAPNVIKHISFDYYVDPDSPEILPQGDRYILGLTELCDEGCQGIVIGSFNHRKVTPDVACCGKGLEGDYGFVSLNKQEIEIKYYTAKGWKTFRGQRTN